MERIDLNGNWFFHGSIPQSNDDVEHLYKTAEKFTDWLPIDVPGDINAALLKHGKIPDPHYDTNAKKSYYWITGMEWWYKLDFTLAEKDIRHLDLSFECIDGVADLWFNNNYLGVVKNTFVPFLFNIDKNILAGNNEVILRFRSLNQLLGDPVEGEHPNWRSRNTFIRKILFNFGWDWSIPMPSIGIAGKVCVEINNTMKFIGFSVKPFCDGRVDFAFEVTREAFKAGYKIEVNVQDEEESVGTGIDRISNKAHKSYCHLNIKNPRLWFPRGYGAAHLYKYTASLIVAGETVDKREGRVGLREVKIIEKPFTPEAGTGYSFEFEINGLRIFCKGANWVPLELWPGMIEDGQYSFYLRKAAEANFNMIRVWGGGFYERDIFYDHCDELGIMVWQDFMFASNAFPVDVLRDEIIREADYQIKRLRNHSSIVLWCGCNEDVYSWQYPDEDSPEEQSDVINATEQDSKWIIDRHKADPEIYTMILRGMVGKFGLEVPYVESSPQSRDDAGNLPCSGNSHVSAWKYCLFDVKGAFTDFREYFDQTCSFDSEFCIQGPCGVNSLKSFMAPENHWPPNENWIFHIQRGHRNMPHHEQTIYIAENIIGKINSLQEYVKYGQTVHLEMMRAEFESARRNRTNCGGTMVWMFNDCWPTSNWSIIDYHKKPKPAYYAAKRACAVHLPIIFERKGVMEFFFSNESMEDLNLEIRYGQENLSGEEIWRKRKKLKLDSNALKKFHVAERKKLTIGSGDYLYIDAICNGHILPRCVYFPDAWENVKWPDPMLEIKLGKPAFSNGNYHTEITVSTDTFARLCHLLYKGKEEDGVWFGDNYFDICAKKSHSLSIQSGKPLDHSCISAGHFHTEWE